ncbi:MAG: aldehyde dehydrogenase family protein [Candidatus Dormibacteraceae bacterium]
MTERFQNLIGGERRDARSAETFEDRNPAHREDLIGLFPRSGAADVDLAVAAAKKSLAAWRRTPAPGRCAILLEAARLLRERKEDLARTMTREMGKVLEEARGDVQEAIDMAEFAAGLGRRPNGETIPSELPDKFCFTWREPVGVIGLVTPWNFPVAVPSWKLLPALAAGNTIVWKPAEDTPLCALRLVETLLDAGLPEGVVNIVNGYGTEAGSPLVAHPEVNCISFTGSTAVGREIGEVCGRSLRRCGLELGGKNGIVVLADADLDLAVDGAVWGGFGTTGQRCTATSRVIVDRHLARDFVDALQARAEALRIGDGLQEGIQVGPIINGKQLRKVDSYTAVAREEGATVVTGGRVLEEGPLGEGWFYAPTIFSGVEPDMRVAREEIFGPSVSILTADGPEEALGVANATVYGLSLSVYTNDLRRAFTAIRELDAGIVYVNAPTIGAEIQLPFGGVKNTGNGHREAGSTLVDEFTEWKSVYIDYSGRLQRAQIDT